MNDIWCPLPWTHISVCNNGDFRLCSHSQSINQNQDATVFKDNKKLNIKTISSIDEVLNSELHKEVRKKFMNNKWPDQCVRCKLDYESGKTPRNIWEQKIYSNNFSKKESFDITKENGQLVKTKLISADLRMGNICDIKCLMCFPGESTIWKKYYNDITGEDSYPMNGENINLKDIDGMFKWSFNETYLDFLVENGQYLKKIKFGGGEPLLLKSVKKFVNKLVKAGFSKNIEIEYSTNVLNLTEELFQIWRNFKRVKLCCSIDGTAEINSFVRNGTDWNKVLLNIDKIECSSDNIEAFISSTYSIFNISNLVDFSNWILNQNFKKINKNTGVLGVTHPVYSPGYLAISLIDTDLFNNLFDTFKSKTNNKHILKRIYFYESIHKKLNKNNEFDKKYFVNYYENIKKHKDFNFYQDEFCEKLVDRWRKL